MRPLRRGDTLGRSPSLRGAVRRVGITATLVTCLVAVPAAGVEERPAASSVVLITIDTLRADALGFAGNERARTPNLDRLAARSRVFDRARAHNVMTLPSHANLLTGSYPWQHGVRDNAGFTLGEEIPTAATLFRAAGFATAAVVGAFPLDARFGLARGFDLYDDRYPEGSQTGFDLAERPGSEVVASGLEWWRAHSGERRFLWLHLFDPHAPYAPAAPFAERFADDPYLGEVAAVDHYLAPLLDELTADGAPPIALVITADHGESLGDHGELTHGLFAYESTLRVPLLLWQRGLAPARVEEPAGHVDVLPTLLAAAGVTIPQDLPGRSLLGPLPVDRIHPFETLNANLTRGWAPLRGVVRAERKYIDLPIRELYDLERDPDETTNLAQTAPGAHAAEIDELAAALPAESEWPPRRGRISPEEERQLAALGYLTTSEDSDRTTFTAADDPKNLVEIDHQIHRYIELFHTGRLKEATAVAREVATAQPQMATAQYHLAQALLEQGRVTEALDGMLAAYERGVQGATLLRQLALTLAEVGQPDRAVAILRDHLDDDPDTYQVYGLVLSESGAQEAATRALERALELDSRHPVALETLALVELRRERYAASLEQAESALALNPDLALAWNYKGLALYNSGRKPEAVEAWREAVLRAPEDYDLLYNLAMVAAEIGERETARQALARFVSGAPPSRYGPDLARARQVLQALEQ